MQRKTITFTYELVESSDFDQHDIADIISFYNTHKKDYEDDVDIAREIADNLCFRDNCNANHSDDEDILDDYSTDDIYDKIWDSIYSSEVDAILEVISNYNNNRNLETE